MSRPRLGRGLAGLGLVLALALFGGARAQGAFSPAPWLQDLDQLRDAMTTGYSNLEWQAQRGLDLPALYARARQRIAAAHDDYEARRAIERFLTAFGDGHLEVRWPAAAAPSPAAGPPPPLCDRLGYFDLRDEGGAALPMAGVTPVGSADAHLKAGLVTVAGRRVGILRVGMFSPHGFPDICATVASRLKLTPASPCHDPCQDAFDRAADALFVDEMAAQLRALAAARADALLVDISGNGGGGDSSLALARMVTARPLTRPRGGAVRGAAWAATLASRQAEAEAALKVASPRDRPALQRFAAALAEARAETSKSCDRAPLWLGRPIACTALVPEPLLDGSWSSVPPPGDPVAAARPVWTGPVIVLVDGDSASSSEWFAAMLQDARAALIVGAPTVGAGCGHMTDAPPVKLIHSGGTVSMPDCYRLRANGDNEAGGVEPDLLVAFREHDSQRQRTARLARVLPLALARAPVAR